MSDDTTGSRIDEAIAAARQGLSDLRDKLAVKADALGDEVSQAVDAVSAKIDEIQAAWAARGSQEQ